MPEVRGNDSQDDERSRCHYQSRNQTHEQDRAQNPSSVGGVPILHIDRVERRREHLCNQRRRLWVSVGSPTDRLRAWCEHHHESHSNGEEAERRSFH